MLVAAGGERSPSWLATLRFTSVEHLPARSHSPSSKPLDSGSVPANIVGIQLVAPFFLRVKVAPIAVRYAADVFHGCDVG